MLFRLEQIFVAPKCLQMCTPAKFAPQPRAGARFVTMGEAQSFFKRSKRFKRFKRFKRKNVDDERNRKKYKNTGKQYENGKYDKVTNG